MSLLIHHPITACPGGWCNLLSLISGTSPANVVSSTTPAQARLHHSRIHPPLLQIIPPCLNYSSYNMPKQPIILSSSSTRRISVNITPYLCTLYYRSSDLRPDRHHVSTFSIFHRRLLTRPLFPSRLSIFSPLPVLGTSRSDTYHVLTCEKYPHSFHHFTYGRSSSDKASVVAGLH